jgi:transcriptional regulator
MYDLPYFKEQDETVVFEFIHKHPFAFLAGSDAEGKPIVTQVPVFIEKENNKNILRGHIMRNTDHHKAFMQNSNALVVFSGPHTYVSATWNYMSVHARGIIRFLDEQALIDVLKKTTLHFENYNKNATTVFDNLPEEYTSRLMKAIVAFEIEITSFDNVFKLSQNRDAKSFENIKHKLNEQDASARFIASEMEKRTQQLFPSGPHHDSVEDMP